VNFTLFLMYSILSLLSSIHLCVETKCSKTQVEVVRVKLGFAGHSLLIQ
jgi:hypothetical protein